MDDSTISKSTVTAFLLIPVVAVLRIGCAGFCVSDLFLLAFGIYSFIICVFQFVKARRYYKEAAPDWKQKMAFAGFCAAFFPVLLTFLLDYRGIKGGFLVGLIIYSGPFLLLSGIFLLSLGIDSILYKADNSIPMLSIIFLISIILLSGSILLFYIIIGTLPGSGRM